MDSALAFAIQTHANSTVFDSLNGWVIDTTLPSSQTAYVNTGTSAGQAEYAFFAPDSLNLDSVSWDFDNGATATGFSVMNTYTNTAVYNVNSQHWKDGNMCSNTIVLDVLTAVKSENKTLKFKIYPNPSASNLVIDTKLAGDIHYSIRTLNGKITKTGLVENTEIDISDLSKGMYLLILEVNGDRYQHKIVKP
jgi:hypothetical protein